MVVSGAIGKRPPPLPHKHKHKMNVYVAYAGNILSKDKMKVIAICTTRDVALHLCSKHAADSFFPLSEDEEFNLEKTGVCSYYAINSVPVDTCF